MNDPSIGHRQLVVRHLPAPSHALREPLVFASDGLREKPGSYPIAGNVLPGVAGNQDVVGWPVELPKTGIAHDQSVLAVIEREALGEGLNGILHQLGGTALFALCLLELRDVTDELVVAVDLALAIEVRVEDALRVTLLTVGIDRPAFPVGDATSYGFFAVGLVPCEAIFAGETAYAAADDVFGLEMEQGRSLAVGEADAMVPVHEPDAGRNGIQHEPHLPLAYQLGDNRFAFDRHGQVLMHQCRAAGPSLRGLPSLGARV